MPGIAAVEEIASGDLDHADATALRIFPTDGKPIADDLIGYLHLKGVQFEQLRVERGRLDDVFRALTTPSAGPSGSPSPAIEAA